MTDQPGRPPEERLSAPRPSSAPVPGARFSAPPSTHRNDLTPERAAKIVRQSASARWVGFLAVTVVALFVIGYYFYELGLPGGMTKPRMQAAAEEQQVIDVERGYNIYQANCAQCHGIQGEGGKGPVLNRQDKLFAHLNPDYIRNMLQVGGRYACGTATSIMPIWSNTGTPPGPLNYKQVNDLIAFLRASKAETFTVRDASKFEPVIPTPGATAQTFTGWVDPAYQPAAGATPYPACWQAEFTSGGSTATPAPSAGASGAPASQAPSGAMVNETALNIAFGTGELKAPADAAFTVNFDNQDAGIPHNIAIKDASGATIFTGDLITGPKQIAYSVKALAAGEYTFICSVHPNMTGTLKVGN